jgi:NADH dehydrogenase [ubiquinone] 1 alpha subcomplex assembly factor 7
VRAFEERLRRLIIEHRPISVARFMALALAHPDGGYYARGDPLGAAGDFVTAPEVSQLFGELVGLALAQHWLDLGRPSRVLLVELGPGRGTLMADTLRAAEVVPGFLEAIGVHLVETSPALRERQAAVLGRLPVRWHDELAGVPQDRPLLLVANEFLDALPIRQFVRRSGRWHERLVAVDEAGAFRFTLAPRSTPFPLVSEGVPEDPPDGTVLELGPAREALAETIAARLVAQGGLALLIDYGHDAEAALLGDTLQGVRRHARVDPLAAPGEVDLSAHVDFGAIGRRAAGAGAAVYGPVGQAAFLGRLGIELRLRRLLERATPTQREALESGRARLVDPDQMGELFQVMALTAPGAPPPPGFDPEERRP